MKPHPVHRYLICIISLAAAIQMPASAATLTNRYSFSGDLLDSVGGMHGTQGGTNALSFSGGSVQLNNVNRNSTDPDGEYIILPPNLVTAYTAITVEAWYTPIHNPAAFADWNRIWEFWNPTGQFFMRSGNASFGTRADIFYPGDGQFLDGPIVADTVESHVVWTSDGASGKAKIYVNGALAASREGFTANPAGLGPTPNDWLGRAKFPDPYLQGSYNEFRIYGGVLNQLEVAASFQSGADTPGAAYGTVTNIDLQLVSAMVVGGQQQVTLLAGASGLTNNAVNIRDQLGVLYVSSSTNVATINSNGVINALNPGSSTISAILGSLTNSKTVIVSQPAAQLRHRYSFNGDLLDSIGGRHGTGFGSGVTPGASEVQLDGAVGSYVDLPGYLIHPTNITQNAVTFETYASFAPAGGGVNGAWTRLFDFGNQGGSGLGERYLFFSPNGPGSDNRLVISDASPGFISENFIINQGSLFGQSNLHVVCVLNANPVRPFLAIYLNGTLAGFTTNMTKSLSGVNNVFSWLGRSLYSGDNWLAATLNEFRIYNGEISAAQVAAGYQQYGPNNTNMTAGNLLAVTSLDPGGPTIFLNSPRPIRLWANYQFATNVNVIAEPGVVLTFSDPNTLAINANGILQPLRLGSVTVTAAFQGFTNSTTVRVLPTSLTLAHRYSFNQASGTNADDSIGTSDATLLGGLALNGSGSAQLDGLDDYIEFPAGTISSLGSNLTFEAWVTNRASGNWSRLFDFGSPGDFMFLAANEGGNLMRFDTSSGGAFNAVTLPNNVQSHVALVYDFSGSSSRLYLNGNLVGSGGAPKFVASMVDTNNWLGRSEFADPFLTGDYNEVRLYSGVLTTVEIARNTALGPNELITAALSVSVAGGNVVISWPDYAVFSLQSSPVLGTGAVWTTVAEAPQWMSAGNTYQITIPITQSARFFRLKR